MSTSRNQCDGVGNATNQAPGFRHRLAQLTQSYQAHGGPVETGSTPQVQYCCLGLDRFGRVIDDNWANVAGTSAPMVSQQRAAGCKCRPDRAERVPALRWANVVGTSARVVSQQRAAGCKCRPDRAERVPALREEAGTHDVRSGLRNTIPQFTDDKALAGVKYGYDRLSSRTWRDNLSPGMTGCDELYGYDQLQRLQDLGRETLNGSQTAITSPTFGQDWTLDETGNWNAFKQDNTGSGTWNLDQSRTANAVNEITSLVNETSVAWTTPAYDKAGNMTRIPVPGTLPDGVAWNPMTLSDWDNLKLADWEDMTLDNVSGVYDASNRLVQLHVGDTTLAV